MESLLSEIEGRRPRPNLASVIAAAGGVLAFFGLTLLLADPDIGGEKINGVMLGLMFTAVGAGLVFVNRSRRAAAGGVALMALAVIPMIQYLFTPTTIDAFMDPDKYRNSQLSILVFLATIWLACYFFGPSRRYAFFLGAAAVALWLVPMTFFTTNATADALDSLSNLNIENTIDDIPSNDIGSPDDLEDLFGDGSSAPDDGNLGLKLGITSLLFGGAYLFLAAHRDQAGDARMATPLFAVAPVILLNAVTYLQADLKVVGVSLLGLVIGSVSIWLGVVGGRRFTSWVGGAWIVWALLSLLGEGFDSAASMGVALTFVGIVVVLVASWLESMDMLPELGGGSDVPGDAGPTLPAGGPVIERAPMPEAWAPPGPAAPPTVPQTPPDPPSQPE